MSFSIAITHCVGDRKLHFAFDSDAPLLFLTGASGTGKTSILNMIAGLIRPDGGRIAIAGRTLFNKAASIDLPPRERGCGYQFQDNRLFPHLTVAQNLAFARAPWVGLDQQQLRERLGIAGLLNRRPLTLSGGEARRVALARALLSARNMLLLDEPTASLNPTRQTEVRVLIADWQRQSGLPVIIASHDMADREHLTGDLLDLDDLA